MRRLAWWTAVVAMGAASAAGAATAVQAGRLIDPVADIDLLQRVHFVMKDGVAYRHERP